jgi:fatty-acyl-CoA synthase
MNVANWIESWAVATPNKIALRFEDDAITYLDFNQQIKRNARMLKHTLGVQPGDRVAYLGQNHPQVLMLVFACARLGAIFMPLNWRLAPQEHLHMLKDSAAETLFIDELYYEQCKELQQELPDCRFVTVQDSGDSGWDELFDLLQRAEGDDCYPDIGMQSPLLLIYTSGTTGKPKGAVLSQEAVQYNAFNSIILHDMNSEDTILTFLPLFHVGGLTNQTVTAFYAGATVILHRVFNPALVRDSIMQEKPTLTIVLPAHMPALRALPDWENTDTSCLRSVMTGSTNIPDEMTRYWHDKKIPLLQMYGSTETCPVAIHHTRANAMEWEGAIGFPAMHCEIRIIDADGNECPVGEAGEILVRGPSVMSYYWNNEEATKNSLVDGWFYTGDIAYVDEKGCYHFADRKKEIIISGSENICPAEIENILMDHHEIGEASVVGRKDERWGEVPVAVVSTAESSKLEKEDILIWLADKLGKYKHPHDVLFVDSLPRNAMGKVEKDMVRELVNP